MTKTAKKSTMKINITKAFTHQARLIVHAEIDGTDNMVFNFMESDHPTKEKLLETIKSQYIRLKTNIKGGMKTDKKTFEGEGEVEI